MVERMVKQQQVIWQCSGKSVIGANHVRMGLPNQDAIAWSPTSGQSLPLILAIADGHGSAHNFRSQIGAALAVQIAVEEIGKFWKLHQPDPTASAHFAKRAKQQLPQILVSKWQAAVLAEQDLHPFTATEWAELEAKEGGSDLQLIRRQPTLAYGSTLLAVLVTETLILYLQLGDGDILCVDAHGLTSRPLPKDARLIANQTTSLCMDNAWQEIRLHWVPYRVDSPTLILLSTDGYANSFVSEADFLQIGSDYQRLLQEQGISGVGNQLEEILRDASQRGSGDDITLGLMLRLPRDVQGTTSSVPASISVNVPGITNRSSFRAAAQSSLVQTLIREPLLPEPLTPDLSLPDRLIALEKALRILQRAYRHQQQTIRALRWSLVFSSVLLLVSLAIAGFSFWRQFQRPGSIDHPASAPVQSKNTPPSISEPKKAASPTSWYRRGQIVSLRVGKAGSITLESGLILYQDQGKIVTKPGNSSQITIAKVVNVGNHLGLENWSKQVWQVIPTNGQVQEIANRKQVQMSNNLSIDFGSLTGRINILQTNAAEISPSPAE